MTGVVLSITGGVYRVLLDTDVVEASLRGRVKQNSALQVLVGDRVAVRRHDGDSATIESIEPRGSVLRRRRPGGARGSRSIAANVDQVVVVGSADHPRWSNGQMDRFLAVAEANELPAALVVNKVDLVEDVPGAIYRAVGYPVLESSVTDGTGLDELKSLLGQHVSLFTGPTGVGKSSLLNAIQPGLSLRTGAVSRRTRTGRHTTVAAEMHPLAAGGFVVDTPGLRDIGLWAMDPAEVAAAFPEIVRLAPSCRFDDCRHVAEPDCAVIAASQSGEVNEGRLQSYRSLLQEAEEASHRW